MSSYGLLLLFTHFLFFTPEGPTGKTSLSGKITDAANGSPLAGVFIYLPDLRSGAVSGSDGTYQLENLPTAKILVQVSYIGYSTQLEEIDLSKIHEKDFSMQAAAREMNAVVVTGSSRSSEIRKNPVPIAAIDFHGIEQASGNNVIDAITSLPGVSAVSTGPNVSKPFIRGLGYNRVLTLVDGIRQEGQQWGDEHGEEVDEYNVDRAEVIKGPASLIYGPDALAGVVNLLSAPPVPAGTISGGVASEYRTNNRMIGATVWMAGNDKGFLWSTRFSHRQATNYQDKVDGRVYGTAFNESAADLMAGLTGHWGYSHLQFSVFHDLQEIPDGSRDSVTRKFTRQINEADTLREIVPASDLSSYKIAILHQEITHYKISSVNNLIIGGSKLAINLGFQSNSRKEFSHPQYPELPGLSLLLHTFTYDVKSYLPSINGWETTIGVNGMFQDNSNQGTEFIIPDYREFDIGPFLFVTKNFEKLALSGGIRYDTRFFSNYSLYVKTDPASGFDMQTSAADSAGKQLFKAFRQNYSGLSGSAGISYTLSDRFLVKLNVARGFRAPNIAEISANGVHPGTDIYQIGNEAFKPEFSLQEDLGIFYNAYHLAGSISFFNNNISNYIFNQKLLNQFGQDSVIVKGNQTFRYVQSRAQLYGAEASLDIHPHPFDWIHFENSVSVTYALNKGGNGVTINDSSKYLPFIPPLHFHSELRIDLKNKIRHLPYLFFNIYIDSYSAQNRVYLAYNTETRTPGYSLLNAGVGCDISGRNGKKVASLGITVTNIGNTVYQSNMSRLKYMEQYPVNGSGRSGIYNMGRNIKFNLTIPLDLKPVS